LAVTLVALIAASFHASLIWGSLMLFEGLAATGCLRCGTWLSRRLAARGTAGDPGCVVVFVAGIILFGFVHAMIAVAAAVMIFIPG
jgi:hypothetical protein